LTKLFILLNPTSTHKNSQRIARVARLEKLKIDIKKTQKKMKKPFKNEFTRIKSVFGTIIDF
jgi:hypothetical protein